MLEETTVVIRASKLMEEAARLPYSRPMLAMADCLDQEESEDLAAQVDWETAVASVQEAPRVVSNSPRHQSN